jgi:zinc/manganese transport system substrate-binding protein
MKLAQLFRYFGFAVLFGTFALGMCAMPAQAAGKIKIVTATSDLAALAQEVGGERVDVESIAKGYQDPHFVEAKPSYLLKLRHADLLVVVGLQLEIGWLPPLITQSGNSRIQVGGTGYLDASQFAEILEKPTGEVTRAQGDVHPFGNPHYWLDPENGRRVAKGIADKLAELRSSDAPYFNQNFESFSQRLTDASKKWMAEMEPYRGRKVITYHRSWPNFLKYFGLVTMGEIEPRPGIPPTPSHTLDLINMVKREHVSVILVEPYFDPKTPQSIARETGAQAVIMPPSVGGEKEITDYFKLFDYDLGLLTKAFQAAKQ